MSADPPPAFLSPAAFARLAGVSESTVRRRIRDGTLPVAQPGGRKSRVLVPRDALDRRPPAAASPTPTPTPPPPVPPPARPRPRWTRPRA